MGLQPERSWHIGDQRPKTRIMEKENGWLLSSGLEESASLEEHLAALLEKLQPISGRIASVASIANIELSCAIYSETQPALSFGSDVIREVANLRASLDVDIYVIGSDEN